MILRQKSADLSSLHAWLESSVYQPVEIFLTTAKDIRIFVRSILNKGLTIYV
jgi:hypothetical protein